jgi:hypothetical protein
MVYPTIMQKTVFQTNPIVKGKFLSRSFAFLPFHLNANMNIIFLTHYMILKTNGEFDEDTTGTT